MAESTLSISLFDLKRSVADYLGYGPDETVWSETELARINGYVESGLRQFYYPPSLPGRDAPPEWSFLRPTATIAVVAATVDYTLPDSFGGGFLGPLFYSGSDNVGHRVQLTSVGEILLRRAGPQNVVGPPLFAALRPRAHDGTGQRWEVLLWPEPDAAYTLTYRYQILPDSIADDNDYPWGGMPHAETIKASCLAVAEMNDRPGDTTWQTYFLTRLLASASVDSRMATEIFGPRLSPWADGSSVGLRSFRDLYQPPLTYNGVLYSGE